MTVSNKEKRKGYPPANLSSHYYTDPVYSSGGFYGFEDDCDSEVDADIIMADSEDFNTMDEPVESWGWINSADNRKVKQ